MPIPGRIFVAALAALLCQPASADEELFRREVRTILFSSAEIASSPWLSFGSKRALAGHLDESGFVAMQTSGAGATWERLIVKPRPIRYLRATADASAMLGYQWIRPGLVISAFAGVAHERRVSEAVSEPRRSGWRVQGDLWWHPRPDTLVSATVVAGGIRDQVWTRVAGGWRVFGLFVGPEAVYARDEGWWGARLGLHATGLVLGPVELRLSSGISHGSGERVGVYSTLGAHWRL